MCEDCEKERIYVERTRTQYPWVWKMYEEMISHELWSVDELHDYNWKMRLSILDYAYRNTVFYRELYDAAGVHPNDVRTEHDWNELPIVTKEMVRTRGMDMRPAVLPESVIPRETATSGSSGCPLSLAFDLKCRGPALEWRHRGWWQGRHVGDLFGANPIIGLNEAWVRRVRGGGVISEAERHRRAAQIFPMRHLYLDSQAMSEENVHAFDAEAERDGVHYVYGYTDAVTELARMYLSGSISRGKWRASLAYVGGTVLTLPARRMIEEALECPVYDVYGCNEVARIAAECPCHDGHLHVVSDRVHLDLVDAAGSVVPEGVEGRTIVTSLHDRVMPLIRYDLGDTTMYVRGGCQCGLPFPRITPIKGRTADCVICRDGSKLSVAGLSCVFDSAPQSVSRFRYVQLEPGIVNLEVVANPYCRNAETLIRCAVNEYFTTRSDRLSVGLKLVEAIPYSGDKMRIVVQG